ncbi:PBECR4 domain-containing protein [Saccharibacillus sp. CPCC 101409]|uniref:PBECR4 domain-containing protein n=1 Tax=Saccharibacillus sp. CPCC 101409 TaxID=3058041 RepID=UPI0026723936|nr:PBECR4 domain-containing protein [Saccharibacillus sp. CPCC 101409]MDO3411239.1 PBECR4 domain-containing protein [Saccharibacillus sp. CPCC 101409]
MNLSVADLASLEQVPTEENLNSQTLASFYEQYLCNKIFDYKVRHSVSHIKLHFKRTDLPHLLGIQYLKTGSHYKGRKGFNELQSGKLTLSMFKEANLGAYESGISRILFFPFIYSLVYEPTCIVFNPQIARSSINAEFMFYNQKCGRYIHLGLRKEESTDLYIPVTFI